MKLLDGWDEHPEPHFASALIEITVVGDLPAAADAYGRTASRYAATGDRYHEIRHRSMNLWCRAQIALDDPAALQRAGVTLQPGLPASVQIKTQSRTLFSYLFGPLGDAFNRSFREE